MRAREDITESINNRVLSLCSRLVGPTASLPPASPFPSSILIMADKEDDGGGGEGGHILALLLAFAN